MEHGGDLEPIIRRDRTNTARVIGIIHALSDRFTGDPFPAMSDHYRGHRALRPGEIGGEAVQRSEAVQLSFNDIADAQHGWNAFGEYQ